MKKKITKFKLLYAVSGLEFEKAVDEFIFKKEIISINVFTENIKQGEKDVKCFFAGITYKEKI